MLGRKPGPRYFDLSERKVVLVGGGKSAESLDLAGLIRTETVVVVINDGFRKLPWADVLFSADGWWIRKREPEWNKRRRRTVFALRATGDWPYYAQLYGHRVELLHLQDGVKLSTREGDCHFADNSGYGALDYVIARGAKKIALAGYDMGPTGWWHGGYEWKTIAEREPVKWVRWRAAFEMIAPEIAARGVDVVNLNPQSLVRCFRFGTLEEFQSA